MEFVISTKIAWALTLLEDPYKEGEWGGDEAAPASIAGMMKVADLDVKGSRQRPLQLLKPAARQQQS